MSNDDPAYPDDIMDDMMDNYTMHPLGDESIKTFVEDDDDIAVCLMAFEYYRRNLDVAKLVGLYALHYLCKEPCRTSALSGSKYVEELLASNHHRIQETLRMDLYTFRALCRILKERGLLAQTRRTTVEEQVAIFLFIVGNAASNRLAQERFQHSGETISK